MKIVKAIPSDLVEILFLLKECVSDLNTKGLKHWNSSFPGSDAMVKAIDDGVLYLYKELGIAKGFAIISEEEPEEYKKLDWGTSSEKTLFIKFLDVHPLFQGNGIAKKIIEYLENYASSNAFSSIRVDIYGALGSANELYTELGYANSGEFHSSFQATPYVAFEKGL